VIGHPVSEGRRFMIAALFHQRAVDDIDGRIEVALQG
jgi:hypothetical protein